MFKLKEKWGDTVTAACVVVAGITEAFEQALSGSPHMATHLPDFHGLGNYAPLCLLIIGGIAWIWGRVRPAGTTTALQLANKASNPLMRAMPHNDGVFDSVEFFRTAYYSVLQDVASNSFRSEAERVRPHDKESFYLDVLAIGSMAKFYDVIWWALYRSQLRALLSLNGRAGVMPLADLNKFYDDASSEFSADYTRLSIDLESWKSFLVSNTLLKIHPRACYVFCTEVDSLLGCFCCSAWKDG